LHLISIGATLPEAFEEWSFTEKTYDHESPVAICNLCDKDKLRYHFLIQNSITQKKLWVGSHCILQFNLSVFEEGQRLSPSQAQKKLERLTQKMRLESCLKSLEALAIKDGGSSGILQGALDYYRKNKVLTPKFAAVVLWRLNERGIDHSPSFFKVCLKRADHKRHLKEMKPRMFAFIWPALSSSQKKTALKLGRTPPL
jgi:hypothetical protein